MTDITGTITPDSPIQGTVTTSETTGVVTSAANIAGAITDGATITGIVEGDTIVGVLTSGSTLNGVVSAASPITGEVAAGGIGSGVSDHGALTGLGDDDHTQYLLASDATSRAAFSTNWTDLTDSGETSLHTHAGIGWDGDITDIDETSSADIGEAIADDDQGIIYNTSGAAWVRFAWSRVKTYIQALTDTLYMAINADIGDLNDVTLSGVQNDDILVYQSGVWVNTQPLDDAPSDGEIYGRQNAAWVAVAADLVGITDTGGYYTSTDVEGALQEIGAGGIGAGQYRIHVTIDDPGNGFVFASLDSGETPALTLESLE